jgi:hypothetical protein
MARRLTVALVDGRVFLIRRGLRFWGESGIHINGVYGAVIWHGDLFAAITRVFILYFWS